MSCINYLACTTCKVRIWIGQDECTYAAAEERRFLDEFLLVAHLSREGHVHNLIAVDEHSESLIEGFQKIETPD